MSVKVYSQQLFSLRESNFSDRKRLLLKRITYSLLLCIVVLVFLVSLIYVTISLRSRGYLYSDIDAIPKRKVGLLLGTSKYLQGGLENIFFNERIKAASSLYHSGKIEFILASGDNSSKRYNEPIHMLNTLVDQGVPREKIILDFAGFRTLDSIVRCKEVFLEDEITIISQKFHNERAISIALEKGLNPIAYNADHVPFMYGRRTYIREVFARIKMVQDLYITDEKPRYLGAPIEIH